MKRKLKKAHETYKNFEKEKGILQNIIKEREEYIANLQFSKDMQNMIIGDLKAEQEKYRLQMEKKHATLENHLSLYKNKEEKIEDKLKLKLNSNKIGLGTLHGNSEAYKIAQRKSLTRKSIGFVNEHAFSLSIGNQFKKRSLTTKSLNKEDTPFTFHSWILTISSNGNCNTTSKERKSKNTHVVGKSSRLSINLPNDAENLRNSRSVNTLDRMESETNMFADLPQENKSDHLNSSRGVENYVDFGKNAARVDTAEQAQNEGCNDILKSSQVNLYSTESKAPSPLKIVIHTPDKIEKDAHVEKQSPATVRPTTPTNNPLLNQILDLKRENNNLKNILTKYNLSDEIIESEQGQDNRKAFIEKLIGKKVTEFLSLPRTAKRKIGAKRILLQKIRDNLGLTPRNIPTNLDGSFMNFVEAAMESIESSYIPAKQKRTASIISAINSETSQMQKIPPSGPRVIHKFISTIYQNLQTLYKESLEDFDAPFHIKKPLVSCVNL